MNKMSAQDVYDESKTIAVNFLYVSSGMSKTSVNIACIRVIKHIFENNIEDKDKQEYINTTLKTIKEMLIVD